MPGKFLKIFLKQYLEVRLAQRTVENNLNKQNLFLLFPKATDVSVRYIITITIWVGLRTESTFITCFTTMGTHCVFGKYIRDDHNENNKGGYTWLNCETVGLCGTQHE